MTITLSARELAAAASGRAAIADVAVAPDGATFAACLGRTLVIADWTSGREIARRDLPATVEAIAFAPDGLRIAAACADGDVALLEVPALAELGRLSSDNGGYRDLAWSTDGACLAAGHYEPLVSVFELAGTAAPTTLDPQIFSDEGRTAVAFAPDGKTLASTAFNAILSWSLPGMKKRKLALREHAFLLDLAFAGDGHALAGIAETEGRMALHLWTGDAAKKLGKIDLPGFSQRLAWSADGTLVAVTERDTPGLSLWDPAALVRSDASVQPVEMAMSAVAAHPRRLAFVAGSEDGRLVIWERQDTEAA